MKNFKLSAACLFLAAIFFAACTKEDSANSVSGELVSLSFNLLIQDLNRSSQEKQSINDIPECSDDLPFYVEIVLMQDDTEVMGDMQNPYRINLAEGQLFTEYDQGLQLPPGTYTLHHFAVYNETGTLDWLAPKLPGDMSRFSDNPLPMDIELRAGTKPYVDVSVLCYDNRDVNEYGYLFFELDATPIIEYCIFANYCNENGRHFPARYSVEVSINGNSLYTEEINITGTNEAGEYFAEPLCIAIPDLSIYDDDEEYVDYTIKLLSWEGVYEVNENIEISGSLSREDIMENFVGEDHVEYEHIFFNCEDDGDGEIPDDLPDIEEATFSNPTEITNPYYGPPQGHIYEYEGYEYEDGELPDEPTEVIYIERRIETKEVMGITSIIQRDYVMEDGVILEDTDDWLAQDDEGNLWYMGELSKNYDDEGNFINIEGSWEAGVDGALPGYWLPAAPFVGQRYYQEWYEGEAEDYAEVIAVDDTIETELGVFENVLVTKDFNPFEEGVYELKYYASGVGLILEEKYQEDELVEIVLLTGIIVID